MNSYHKIHWWQFPLKGFSIKLNSKYKKFLFNKIYEERSKSNHFSKFLNDKSKKYGKHWNFKKQRLLLYEYKKHTKFVPAWVIFCATKYLRLDLFEVEKNIESYVSFRGRLVVSKPKLPVEVTPEFTALAIHTMCDGCNHLDSIIYAQKDKKEQSRFLKLAINVFGEYRIKNNRYAEILPKIFSRIISSHYNITDYSTFGASIPSKIKQESFQHRLAALISFILDEGSVYFGIDLRCSNKQLLSDIHEIAESLDYDCNPIREGVDTKTLKSYFTFTISPKSIKKIYRDLISIYKIFPGLKFGKKMDRIHKIYNIHTRKWKQRGKGKTTDIIKQKLKESRKTAFELSDSTEICLRTVHYHLNKIGRNLSKTREGNQIYYCILD